MGSLFASEAISRSDVHAILMLGITFGQGGALALLLLLGTGEVFEVVEEVR